MPHIKTHVRTDVEVKLVKVRIVIENSDLYLFVFKIQQVRGDVSVTQI